MNLTERQQAKLAMTMSTLSSDSSIILSQSATEPLRTPPETRGVPSPAAPTESGDSLLGRRVVRRFAGFGEFWGTIATARAIDGQRTWYRVDYDDGDCEEYNAKEVERMMELASAKSQQDPRVPAEPSSGGDLGTLSSPSSDSPPPPPPLDLNGAPVPAASVAPPVTGANPTDGSAYELRKLEVDFLEMGFPRTLVTVRLSPLLPNCSSLSRARCLTLRFMRCLAERVVSARLQPREMRRISP